MAPPTAKPVADPAGTARYERKLLVTGVEPAFVEHAVRTHPVMFTEVYRPRFVNNCYFDSPGLEYYRDAVEGHGNRLKVRVRWYGPLFGPVGAATLELKRKSGAVGTKDGFPVPPFVFDQQSRLGELATWFGGALPGDLDAILGSLRPTLINRYRRRYFASADRRFRLTLDTDCQYHSVAPPRSRAGRSAIDDYSTIVELKFSVADAVDAAEVSSALPFRITKSSKYVTGLTRLGIR